MINKKKIIFCFDIDNTICSTNKSDYHNSIPNKKMIKLINSLFRKGHIIKIFTARYMGRNKNNQKKINTKYKSETRKQLKLWGVNYNNLIFGKPSFDYLIDDKSMIYEEKKVITKLKKYLN